MSGVALTLWLASGTAAVAGISCYEYRYAPNLVRAVQKLLKEQGLYQGRVDGKWGRQTEAAVAKFQSREHIRFATFELTASNRGQLEFQTLAAMFGADATAGVTVVENPHSMPGEIWSRYCTDYRHQHRGEAQPQ